MHHKAYTVYNVSPRAFISVQFFALIFGFIPKMEKLMPESL